MFSSIKTILIAAGIVVLLLGGFLWYYRDSQSRINQLIANAAQMTTALNIEKTTNLALQADVKRMNDTLTVVNTEFDHIREQNRQLVTSITSHDIDADALAHANLVQTIINRATAEANRCFEVLSGSPLTTEERNAKTTNSQCPDLFNSR